MSNPIQALEHLAEALCHAYDVCPDATDEVICRVAGASLAGMPGAVLTELRDEARFWAGTASVAELRAYAWAITEAMPDFTRRRFLEWANARGEARQ